MQISLATTLPDNTDCLVIPIAHKSKAALPASLPDGVTEKLVVANAYGMDLDVIASRTFSIQKNSKLLWVVLVTVGKNSDAYAFRSWVDGVIKATKSVNAKHIALDFDYLSEQFHPGKHGMEKLVCRAQFASYVFNHYKTSRDSKIADKETTKLVLTTSASQAQSERELHIANAMADGQAFARDLGNLAPNDCTTKYITRYCRDIAKQHSNFTLHEIDKKQMKKLGFGAFLAVAQGSAQNPRLVILEYKHPKAKGKPHALLGKGITFDTGGISLKPAGGMEEMKFDMCGTASVLGACKAIAAIQPRINAIFALALAENMPGGKASRPGDIVTTYSGQTVEILNTDAEGRLVLCDSLTYLQKHFSLAGIVDIATLTGACVIALGHHLTALYSNNDPLAASLQQAALDSDDHLWRMPLHREYADQLSSNIADIPNIPGGRDAGSVTAACYLEKFIDGINWAHLDIAGTAWVSGKNKLATGRPTLLLTRFLLGQAPTES